MRRQTGFIGLGLALCLVACGDEDTPGFTGTFGDASESASVTVTASASATDTAGDATATAGDDAGTSGGDQSGGSDSGTSASGTTATTSAGGGTDTDSASGGTTGGGGGTSASGGGTTGGTADCECVQGLDDGIFVLSDNSEIYKYLPGMNVFNFIGSFACPGLSSTFSMAVDRNGIAWVMHRPSGDIRHIDLTTFPLTCSNPGYSTGQVDAGHGPYNLFGMAFVSNSDVDRCDKLYGNTFDDSSFSEGPVGHGEFLVVDPMSLLISYIGGTTFNGAELTGTGDGRAYMFGGTNPAKLVEVDKSNATYNMQMPLGNLDLTYAFAFAFFEGDFYFFTESGGIGTNSKVTHLDFDGTGLLNNVPGTAPIRIVGAGVSTCVKPEPQ